MQTHCFPERSYIFDLLLSVVVDPCCLYSAAGAFMYPSMQFNLYMPVFFVFPSVFYDYIFQSEKFCCIIFHRAYDFLSDVVWSLIS